MASQPNQKHNPFCLRRTISLRPARTTDGYIVYANKHYTIAIEDGTLRDAVQKGFIGTHDAILARANKASDIARENNDNIHNKLDNLPNLSNLSNLDDLKPAQLSFDKCIAELFPYIPEEDAKSC